jgi:hypothetical protein
MHVPPVQQDPVAQSAVVPSGKKIPPNVLHPVIVVMEELPPVQHAPVPVSHAPQVVPLKKPYGRGQFEILVIPRHVIPSQQDPYTQSISQLPLNVN